MIEYQGHSINVNTILTSNYVSYDEDDHDTEDDDDDKGVHINLESRYSNHPGFIDHETKEKEVQYFTRLLELAPLGVRIPHGVKGCQAGAGGESPRCGAHFALPRRLRSADAPAPRFPGAARGSPSAGCHLRREPREAPFSRAFPSPTSFRPPFLAGSPPHSPIRSISSATAPAKGCGSANGPSFPDAAARARLPALPRDPAPGRAAPAAGRGAGGSVPGRPPRRPPRPPRPRPPPQPAPRPAALPGARSSMLYFQVVIMAGTVMLAYYFEYTDTFSVNVQGFFCHDSAYRKPYPGPEDRSAVPPVLLYSLAAGVPALVIIVGETAVFCLQLATRDFENQEKTILTGDCCYINPLVRRTVRFLGIYTFGLFATDIFVNAGQVVTGNLAPHFLALCKPNYTALGCQQYTQFISGEEACTGNPDLIMRARKTFPSKEAALSVYAAMYLTMYITNTIKAKGTRLAKPVLCLGLMCLAFLTGLNRVAEYRNHWSDVIAGFLVGISIAVFLVVCVVNNFKGRQPENERVHMDNLAQMPMISIPRVESPLEKISRTQPFEDVPEETSQGRSFKDCLTRLFSWIMGISHCEHLQLRQ
ncbi:phospholipid phosphatase-related protein type 5 [Sorex araneus]|uniref:phospholipid phosphatase-related protein type 5 n=1 Tax=Sorex araneus TaxID=42254 RepID=UPI0024337F19|nr:phospholipid phosphatase-related protein type 5 [Sorex araneus]